MEQLFGKLSLCARSESADDRASHVATINEVISPPQPASSDDIYLGALYAASDQVNLQGGCFAREELARLAELVIGAPILVGHQKQQLPIGRAYQAEIVTRDDAPWLKVYFYWSRKQAGADQLKAGIDSGIYSECSLAFQYGKPECAICRGDMRHCRHRIGQPVQLGGREIKAFYYYKDLARVLEISLVYRGAVQDTRVESLAVSSSDRQVRTSAAHNSDRFDPFWRNHAKPVFELTQVSAPIDEAIAEPLYNGLWCLIEEREGELKVTSPNGETLGYPVLERVAPQVDAEEFQVLAQIYPYKGNSRLPLADLLGDKTDKVKVVLFDIFECDGRDLRGLSLIERKRLLAEVVAPSHEVLVAPWRNCKGLDMTTLDEAATSYGLILSAASESSQPLCEYRRQPLFRVKVGGSDLQLVGQRNHVKAGQLIWARPSNGNADALEFVDFCQPGLKADAPETLALLQTSQDSGTFHLLRDQENDCWLVLSRGKERQLLRIRKLDLQRLQQQRRFWCEYVALDSETLHDVRRVQLLDKGEFRSSDATSLHLSGEKLRGHFLIQLVTVGGQSAHLFYTRPAQGRNDLESTGSRLSGRDDDAEAINQCEEHNDVLERAAQ